jgi:hypothetical protein
VEQYHQLQKECEDLKDAKSTAEARLAASKMRVQQLEKEAQIHDQLLSKFENQVLFPSEDKPLQLRSFDFSLNTHSPAQHYCHYHNHENFGIGYFKTCL